MYLLYVDESGDPGPHGSPFLILTGAALFEGRWSVVRRDLDVLLNRFWPVPPRPVEIHMAELRAGKGAFRTLPGAARGDLETELHRMVTSHRDHELRVITVIADKATWFAAHPGATGDDLYVALFEDLSSRFELFLKRRAAYGSPSEGIIIADPHKERLSRAIRAQHRAAQQSGNRWISVDHIIETVFFLSSEDSPGLQVADICSYAVHQLVNHGIAAAARALADCFDREPQDSDRNAGKWHGVKYLGADPAMLARLGGVWPGL